MVVGLNAGGLGVVRSLKARGVSVIAVDDTINKPEMATGAATRKLRLPIRESALVDGLLNLARELPERPVLMVTQRLPLVMVSQHRERLRDAYRLVLPDHGTVVAMENKEHLITLAATVGVSAPRTLVLDTEEALNAARGLRYPLILKPSDNDLAYMERFDKTYIVRDHGCLEDLAHRIWPCYAKPVLQEWIEGGDDQLYFCLQYRNAEGRARASFVGRKLLSWPPGKGATAACAAATDHQAEVEALTNRMFNAIGMRGFCSVEFKRDSVTGKFYMIEPTVGRTDQQEEVAMLNGINIPFAAYCDQIGAPVPPMTQTPESHTWSCLLEARWAKQQLRDEGHRPPCLRVGKGRVHDAHFRIRDPMPGMLNLLQIAPSPINRLMETFGTVLGTRRAT